MATLDRIVQAPAEPSVFVLLGLGPFLAAPMVQSALWRLGCGGPGGAHVVLLVDSPSAYARIPEALRSAWRRLDDPLPTRETFQVEVDRVLGALVPAVLRRRVAGTLAGFTWTAGVGSLHRALAGGKAPAEDVAERVGRAKRDLLRQALNMEILDPEAAVPVGLDLLSRYVEERRAHICATGKDRCRGVLLVGPPGTGKSLSAREIGRVTGHPVVDFRIASLMDSLVGATENNFLHATRALDAMAPCVVFIDEVEKALAGGAGAASTDGGVMARSHGTLLSWLNDSRSPVFVVGTANHLDRMEDWRTFARKGRFDDDFFVDVPGPRARGEILRRELPALEQARLDDFSRRTAGFSGADLDHACRQARIRAASPRDVAPLLAGEVDQMAPKVLHALRDFARLRSWARDNFRPASSEVEET